MGARDRSTLDSGSRRIPRERWSRMNRPCDSRSQGARALSNLAKRGKAFGKRTAAAGEGEKNNKPGAEIASSCGSWPKGEGGPLSTAYIGVPPLPLSVVYWRGGEPWRERSGQEAVCGGEQFLRPFDEWAERSISAAPTEHALRGLRPSPCSVTSVSSAESATSRRTETTSTFYFD